MTTGESRFSPRERATQLIGKTARMAALALTLALPATAEALPDASEKEAVKKQKMYEMGRAATVDVAADIIDAYWKRPEAFKVVVWKENPHMVSLQYAGSAEPQTPAVGDRVDTAVSVSMARTLAPATATRAVVRTTSHAKGQKDRILYEGEMFRYPEFGTWELSAKYAVDGKGRALIEVPAPSPEIDFLYEPFSIRGYRNVSGQLVDVAAAALGNQPLGFVAPRQNPGMVNGYYGDDAKRRGIE